MTRLGLFFWCFLTTLFSTISLAQKMPVTDYNQWWQRIDTLILAKGQSKTALTEVNKLYSKAKAEKATAQSIKALVYRMSLSENLQEYSDTINLRDLQAEINKSSGVQKALLQNLKGSALEQHFNQNRWKIYGQPPTTTQYKKENIRTWGIEDYHREISASYLASISNRTLLEGTSLAVYEPIITKGNSRKLRPTLYDLLAWRALDYFSNEERGLNKPADAYKLDNPKLFLDAEGFAKLKLESRDSTAHHFQALKVYQQLLASHMTDKDKAAMVNADIARLQFVHRHSVMEEKDSLYVKALQHLAASHKDLPEADQAKFLIAQYWKGLGDSYQPHGPASPRQTKSANAYKEAMAICQAVLVKGIRSEGSENCSQLLQEISSPFIQMQVEKVNVPGKPFRSLVSWKNTGKVYLRLFRISENQKAKFEFNGNEEWWESIARLKEDRMWSQELPATSDYHQHSAEIRIDALPVGEYAILASHDQAFSSKTSKLAFIRFHVSNIAYVNNGDYYFVMNRETGQPLQNASIQTWFNDYDYQTRKYIKTKDQQLSSNKDGYFQLKAKTGRSGVQLEINHGNDHLFLDDQEYISRSITNGDASKDPEAYEKAQARVFFFTDRSIYRPGQPLYFKGILVTRDKESRRSKILPNRKTTVALLDANGDMVDSLDLTTNDFGSISGTFTLPAGGLTGEFQLIEKNYTGEVTFSVEEYKRPRFDVEIAQPKGTYRVDDTITVKGTARAYAGNAIDRAMVKYRVVRTTRIPYFWSMWKGLPTRSASMEITNGQATTDKDGNFSISFKAIPDLSIEKEGNPVFDYEVSAEVTDLNGETRTGETMVHAGYSALVISIQENPGLVPIQEWKSILLKATNTNGEPVSTKASIRISPIQSPDKLIRKRYWSKPDMYVMGKEEFAANFPYDEYQDESDILGWPVASPIQEQPIVTRDSASTVVPINPANSKSLQPGWYQVMVTATDPYGVTVTDKQNVFLFNPGQKQLPVQEYLFSNSTSQPLEPGQVANLQAGSSAGDSYLFSVRTVGQSEEEENEEQLSYSLTRLDNSIHSYQLPITEKDKGGFTITHWMVKHNRFFEKSEFIQVPWLEKELEVKTSSFRDKTLPGSEEKWSVQVSGRKGEKKAAELLTSMYDASLDQFQPHQWERPGLWPTNRRYTYWNSNRNFGASASLERQSYEPFPYKYRISYDQLLWGSGESNTPIMKGMGYAVRGKATVAQMHMAPENTKQERVADMAPNQKETADAVAIEAHSTLDEAAENTTSSGADQQVQVRKNFAETAFFFPQLQADANGTYSFTFTMPEAVTRWKWQMLAHTRDLAMGYAQREIVTRKDLMVQPNLPRFLREGDRMEIVTKVVNVTDKEMTGQVELQLIDATTNQPVDGWFRNFFPNQYFTVAANSSEAVKFPIEVPYQFDKALTWRIIARAGNVSDGESATLPVLSNRQLVTETQPFFLTGNESRTIDWKKLRESGESETLSHKNLTVEFSSNPAWYAVQALPYLTDYPYDCSEQTFNRLYANLLAALIVDKAPRIRGIMQQWQGKDTAALMSNLQKNQELKQVLLEETPWVLEARNEAEQKRRIATLFNLVQLSRDKKSLVDHLIQLQTPNGGFSWFSGGPDNRFITQYIITGIGHLRKLGAGKDVPELDEIVRKALPYLDARMQEDYEKDKKGKASVHYPNSYAAQYLYMRSFFMDKGIPGQYLTAVNHYRKELQQNWVKGGRMLQAMVALSLHRTGDKQTALNILRSLEENAIRSKDLGMYWKDNIAGFYWHEAPIETQALLIEAFSEISNKPKLVGEMKAWLLKNKQTNRWSSTKATADACYALLMQGNDWLAAEPKVSINLGGVTTVTATKEEAGTGYYQKIIPGTGVFPEMGKITINAQQAVGTSNDQPVWGAIYWQYFENLDKISPAAGPLRLRKQVMVERATDRGPVLEPVTEGMQLNVGDKVSIRLEITTDRDMEFVHLKDMRASALEPTNVLSGYKWQGRLGYYESTRDASTNFFIDYLPKGTHVLNYTMFVSHAGVFSNGISTIQCMYAPEFTSHSEGVKISVE
ncbi:MG2 domain-containing protein [Flavihumibacter rivuli]|uniref:alpha-2-macroglobulin family protein n=1 Tax=Flavihumibacter rivuli TaxID=2838156 RepID=UPI001BDE2B24|nr:alpha-2-macroglobulin family protein [Flavihumibacter rivuli]ULQ56617.1 MG2 domain-containing protein [Flavihumibacter rivuli]